MKERDSDRSHRWRLLIFIEPWQQVSSDLAPRLLSRSRRYLSQERQRGCSSAFDVLPFLFPQSSVFFRPPPLQEISSSWYPFTVFLCLSSRSRDSQITLFIGAKDLLLALKSLDDPRSILDERRSTPINVWLFWISVCLLKSSVLSMRENRQLQPRSASYSWKQTLPRHPRVCHSAKGKENSWRIDCGSWTYLESLVRCWNSESL